jgi:hypothetical protein
MKPALWVKKKSWLVLGMWGLGVAVVGRAQTTPHVVINEIMADNESAVANAGTFPDWLELYNPAAQNLDLAGWGLTRSLAEPKQFTFPAGAVLASKGFLVIWCDSATNLPGLHSGWTLKKASDEVALFDAAGALVDHVQFGLQLPDISLGRSPDGAAQFAPGTPTPLAANRPLPAGPPTQVKINEWLASSDGPNWFELYNPAAQLVDLGGCYLSNTQFETNESPFAVRAWSFMAPGGYQQIWADWTTNAADHVYFSLSASRGKITLFASDGTTIYDSVKFGAQTKNVSQGRWPDGATNLAFFIVPTPGDCNFQYLANVVINEVLANSDPPLADAIELYNPTTNAAKIGNWWLSNSQNKPKKYRLPPGAEVPPGAFLVFYATQFSSAFTLSAQGDDVYLNAASNDASGTLLYSRTFQNFGPSANGVSFGRYVNSQGRADFVPMDRQTFGTALLPTDSPLLLGTFLAGKGAPNARPKLEPIVISEIMYHPPMTSTNADDVLNEYVVLQNWTSTNAYLFDNAGPMNGYYYDPKYGVYADGRTNAWHVGGSIDFIFPRNLSLAPGARLLLVNFDPATNAPQVAQFRAKYGFSIQTPLYGPYGNKLPNGSGTVELYKPGAPITPGHADVGTAPYLLVESIAYSDAAPWPKDADGKGLALQRLSLGAYGNDPTNWCGLPVLHWSMPQRTNTTSLTLSFASGAGLTYTVQYRVGLPAGNPWLNLTNLSALPTNILRQVTFSTTNAPNRFYRLVSPAQP